MPMSKTERQALQAFFDRCAIGSYVHFPKGSMRDRLRSAGLIERWNPSLKATGRIKPWRITEAGRLALKETSNADR